MKTKVIPITEVEIKTIKNRINQNNNVNLVLDMRSASINETDLEEIFKFADKSNRNGTTFVVVKENVDFDAFSQEWNIVPTIEEANDLISLDEMMRNLE